MADVVDEEAVAITPTRHVKVVCGSPVVVPEGFVEEEIASTAIVSETKGVSHDKKTKGLPESGLPAEFFRR
jgi:hypothetical protein